MQVVLADNAELVKEVARLKEVSRQLLTIDGLSHYSLYCTQIK